MTTISKPNREPLCLYRLCFLNTVKWIKRVQEALVERDQERVYVDASPGRRFKDKVSTFMRAAFYSKLTFWGEIQRILMKLIHDLHAVFSRNSLATYTNTRYRFHPLNFYLINLTPPRAQSTSFKLFPLRISPPAMCWLFSERLANYNFRFSEETSTAFSFVFLKIFYYCRGSFLELVITNAN